MRDDLLDRINRSVPVKGDAESALVGRSLEMIVFSHLKVTTDKEFTSHVELILGCLCDLKVDDEGLLLMLKYCSKIIFGARRGHAIGAPPKLLERRRSEGKKLAESL